MKWAALAAVVLLAGCAARTPPRPTGPGTPDPTAIDAFTTATKQCLGLRTLTSEIRLSGRAGGERLRGTLHAGLTGHGALRFEAMAPFGAPVFILAGRENRATLYFPRDNRVLEDVALADVLDRLTALPLNAHDVRLVLTGCLGDPVTPRSPSEGRAWNGDWFAVTITPDITAYVRRRNGIPIIAAADYGPWLIDYADHVNGWPRTVRIRSRERGRVDATARLAQLEINGGIDLNAFIINVPPDAERMTLNDLRAIAPLRGTQE